MRAENNPRHSFLCTREAPRRAVKVGLLQYFLWTMCLKFLKRRIRCSVCNIRTDASSTRPILQLRCDCPGQQPMGATLNHRLKGVMPVSCHHLLRTCAH
eukprot:6460518-Amphidinium_carterae.2